MPVALRVGGDTYTTIYESMDDLDDNLRSAAEGSIAIPFTAVNGKTLSRQGELILRPMAVPAYALWETEGP